MSTLLLEPLELLERLAALVPPPRRPLMAYYGLLAPRARWRSAIVPRRRRPTLGAPAGEPSRRRWPWPPLLRRVFATEVLVCERYGGPRRILGAVTEPHAVRRPLAALGSAWRASRRQGGRLRRLIRRRSRPPPRDCPPSACRAGGAGSGPPLTALQSSLPGRSAARYNPAIVTRCGHWADTEPTGRGAGDKKHASDRLRTIASSILTSQHTASGSAHHQFHPRLALEVGDVPENSGLADVELHGGRRKGASSGEGRERSQRGLEIHKF